MKYAKAFIGLCLIICILFTVSGVCAGEVHENMTDISASEDIQIESSENNEIIGETDDGTFTTLQKKINEGYGTTLILENDYENDGHQWDGVKIKHSITIDGQGHKLDGKNEDRIIYVEGDNVTLKNIVFVNGNPQSNVYAGAIHFYETINCNIINCTFIDNSAKEDEGAICMLGCENCIITNCTFKHNIAQTKKGGALSLYSCKNCVVSNSSFTDNYAETNGGAIYLSTNYNCIIANCTFKNNTANEEGGALFFTSCENETLFNCTFIDNKARTGETYRSGGAIYWENGDNCSISNSTFKGNKAAHGGAIHLENGNNINISNCSFKGNDGGNGGAIRLTSSSNSTISNCEFTQNTANDKGIVHLIGDDNIVCNCDFTQNTANEGGSIYLSGSRDRVLNCDFKANNGGAICLSGSNGTVTDCEFTANKGIAIRLSGDNTTVTDCEFTANNGSAIQLSGDNTTVTDCDFISNNGSAIQLSGAGSKVSGCLFVNCTSAQGIIHYQNDDPSRMKNLKINENIFLNNNGTAIVFNQNDTTSNTNFNWFAHNSTNYIDGPDSPEGTFDTWIFLNGTANPNQSTDLVESSIVFNLYVYNSTSERIYETTMSRTLEFAVSASGGNVDRNTAKPGETVTFTPVTLGTDRVTAKIENVFCTVGIEILTASFEELKNLIDNAEEGSTITLQRNYLFSEGFENGININKNLTIDGAGNIIDGAGKGRIFHVASGNVVFKNITLINGYTGQYGLGGAIWTEDAANTTAIDCEFKGNYAWDGGAMANGKAVNCTFTSNWAHGMGGAIYNGLAVECTFNSNNASSGGAKYGGDAINCTFNSNSAIRGGAIFEGGAVDCTFNSNWADAGGAIFCISSYGGVAVNCTFNSNWAAQFGGAIDGYDAINCTFSSNHANKGGAMYKDADNAKAYDCVFLNNYAKNGGAITMDVNVGEIYNCRFVNNSAENGGAVYYKNYVKNNVVNSTFTNNTAEEYGGGTYNGDAVNCIFTGNDANQGGAMYSGKVDSCIFKTPTDTYSATGILPPILNVTNETFEYSSGKIALNLTANNRMPIDNANISISVYYKENNTLVGNYSCPSGKEWKVDLPAGFYVAVFNTEYEGFTPVNATITIIKANSTLTVPDITFDYGSTGSAAATFTNAIGIIAEVTDHSEANITVNGNVITISNLGVGNYTLTVSTITTGNYNNVTKTANITVNKAKSTLIINNVELDYGSTTNVTATFKGATGITAEIDGQTVNVTGNTIPISGLNAGIHTLTVTTIPDANHTAVTATVNITVKKLNTAITAANKAYVINYGGTYTATLRDANGNALAGQKVTFTLNGKNIGTAVTNAQGTAGIKLTAAALKTAKAGTKNLVIKFAGDSNYVGASKTVKITINKEKTKIVAKKKTFKKSLKVKKYTITLKNSKNKAVKKVQVTLKVKGKTYKAKTNSKGKATFKIKKLTKKGTFKATIKFKGNKYYKAVTKKVKITIK